MQKNNYYHQSRNADFNAPKLKGEHTADICIIGGGFTGLSCALELSQFGYQVVLLEAHHIGYGASGRNGGQICRGYSCAMTKIENQIGKDNARICWDVSQEALKKIKNRIEHNQIPCDLKWGYLHVARRKHHLPDIRHMHEECADYGYNQTTILDAHELSQKLKSTRYHGALHDPGAGHLHPFNYCLGLARAIEKAGGKIFEYSKVLDIKQKKQNAADTIDIITQNGVIHAKIAVAAGNAYLEKLIPPLYRKIMPVGSYIGATQPINKNLAQTLIPNQEAVADMSFILDYFRLSPDHRLLFGGRCSYTTLEPFNLKAVLHKRMCNIFPQLKHIRFDYVWGGHIGITMNRVPDIGRIGQNLYYAHGYSGQGVALSGMFGSLIADAIHGEKTRFDILSKLCHPSFPGGPIRAPLLALGMLWCRLRDIIG